MPAVLGQIPWFHNVILVEKIKDSLERLWYAHQAVEHGWSRDILAHQIESGLYERQGKAVTNFKRMLPASQSDLAHQAIKDPYTFDFLTLAGDVRKPIGVSAYKLTKALPEKLRGTLPTIKDLKSELRPDE